MYFSLVPNPGYNTSFLDTCGIDGEWDLFIGNSERNGTGYTWQWGSVNHSIEGKLSGNMRTIINYIFKKIFGLRVELML